MNALIYLFFTKIKASIRNVFSKWTSALITIISLGFGVFMAYLIFTQRDILSATINVTSVEGWMMLYCGYALFFLSAMILQKRTSMVYANDAKYIFAGPFSRRQTLGFLLAETVQGSMVYAVIAVLYVAMMMGGDVTITFGTLGMLLLGGLLMFYFVFALITFFYFWEITTPWIRKLKIGLLIGVLVVIAAVLGYSVLTSGGLLQDTINSFLVSPAINFIPVFGWVKYGMAQWIYGNTMASLGAMGATTLLCVITTWLIINIKGDFIERAMEDAQWITEFRAQARQRGGNQTANQKIHTVKETPFASGAAALLSKSMLNIRKSRSWVSLQEIIMIAIYLFISYINESGFSFYQYFILIVMYTSANLDSLQSDMKKIYVYLIPEKPLKKLFYLILPSLLRMTVVSLVAIVPAIFLFQVEWITGLWSILQTLGYACLFLTCSLWSMRLLRSRTSVFAEQMIKMFVMVIAAIPATALGIIVALQFPQSATQIMAMATVLVNVLMAAVLLFFSRSLLMGNNLISD